MPGPNTIKEFLVELGFAIDANGLRRFTSTLANVTKGALALGAAIEGAAAATLVAVEKMAASFEQLYYASQRAGSSVENIKALQYGMEQIGLAAGSAQQVLEGLAMSMRLNPGKEGLLNALGVQTRDAHGTLRDTDQMAISLVQRLKQMPFYIASQYAGMFGMDPRTLLMLEQNIDALANRENEFRQEVRESGVDMQKSAESSRDFMNEMRRIGTVVELLWTKVSTALIGQTLPALKTVREWLLSHFRDISDATQTALGSVLDLAGAIGKDLLGAAQGIATGLRKINWNQYLPDVSGVKDAFKGLGDEIKSFFSDPVVQKSIGLIIDALVRIGAFAVRSGLDAVTASLKTFQGLLHAIADVLTGQWSKAWDDGLNAAKTAADGLRKIVRDLVDTLDSTAVGRWLQRKLGIDHAPGPAPSDPSQDYVPIPSPTAYTGGGATIDPGVFWQPSTGSGRTPLGVRQNNPGNLRSWTGAGSANGFAVFRTAYDGLVAMRQNLQAYARRGLDTVQGIISRWAPSSENNTGGYIASVARALGVAANQHLNMSDPGVLSRLMAAMIRFEQGASPYSMGMIAAAAGAGGGVYAARGPISIQQRTEIHVAGGSDPVRTGREVANHQRRVNGDLVRNMGGIQV